ncbi:MAG: MFS transporter [Syntrophobacteraceae bacterium]
MRTLRHPPAPAPDREEKTRFKLLGAISVTHFLNDMLQSLIYSIYPLLKTSFLLSFTQIGLITLTYQITASVFQPFVGYYTDRHPKPYSLCIGMGSSLIGIVVMAFAPTYTVLLIAAALIGLGSSINHPESSRVARMASGGRFGLAQSLFQVGGNAGSAMGPLLAAWIIIPGGRSSLAWFSLAALFAMFVLLRVGGWYKRTQLRQMRQSTAHKSAKSIFSSRAVLGPMSVLLILMFSKFFYLSSLTSYYTFYLIHRFHVSVQSSQIHLFAFLSAMAVGTIMGGPVGDRIGRKRVIWVSILGAAPFTLMLPYVDLAWTGILTFIIGLIIASAFSAIVVFGQELMPGNVGMVSGLFFGLAFGIAAMSAAALGKLADMYGIEFVYHVCSYLPLLGLLTVFLPDIRRAAPQVEHR